MGAPQLRTMSAASGSTYTLNSAAGVIFPHSKYAPAIITMPPIRDAMSGASTRANAEIGHGGKRNYVHFPRRRGAQRLHDEVHSMLPLRFRCGRGQVVSIKTGRPVYVVGNDQLFQNRARTSREDRNVSPPRKLQDLERVEDGMIESDIACGGHETENLKRLRRGQHHHDGRRLVLPGVGGHNHFGWLQGTFSLGTKMTLKPRFLAQEIICCKRDRGVLTSPVFAARPVSEASRSALN